MSPREATPVGTTVLRTPLTTRMAMFAAVVFFVAAAVWRLVNSSYSGGSLVATIVLVVIALILIAFLPMIWKYAVWTSPDGMTLYTRIMGPKSTRSIELRSPTRIEVKRVRGMSNGEAMRSQIGTTIVSFRRPGQPKIEIRTPGVSMRSLMRLLQPALNADPSLAVDDYTAKAITDPSILPSSGITG